MRISNTKKTVTLQENMQNTFFSQGFFPRTRGFLVISFDRVSKNPFPSDKLKPITISAY